MVSKIERGVDPNLFARFSIDMLGSVPGSLLYAIGISRIPSCFLKCSCIFDTQKFRRDGSPPSGPFEILVHVF